MREVHLLEKWIEKREEEKKRIKIRICEEFSAKNHFIDLNVFNGIYDNKNPKKVLNLIHMP